jgi:ribonuclease BN (tRNA processing enzyme)
VAAAGSACSGFLVEQSGFRSLLDVGFAALPRLLGLRGAEQVDAVFVSHRHPDYCADLNPLLRARMLREHPAQALDLYAPAQALDRVLALERPGMSDADYRQLPVDDRAALEIGPTGRRVGRARRGRRVDADPPAAGHRPASLAAAQAGHPGPVHLATDGLVVDLD